MDRKRQGDLGVAKAIAYYVENGYDVSMPLTDATRYDLIVDNGTQLFRVQVKSSNQFTKYNVPTVTLSTQGGNQSWNGTKKFISPDETDVVFVYHLNGCAWELPVLVCAGRGSMSLGKLQEAYKVIKSD